MFTSSFNAVALHRLTPPPPTPPNYSCACPKIHTNLTSISIVSLTVYTVLSARVVGVRCVYRVWAFFQAPGIFFPTSVLGIVFEHVCGLFNHTTVTSFFSSLT